MDRINLNKLYYFYVVAKEGSVKAASQKLHLTQPTISTQIKQLEEDLGFEVFIRRHRRLDLNRNGKFVLRKAEKLFTLADDLLGALPARGKAQRTKVKIGATPTLSNSFIHNFSLSLWKDPTTEICIIQGTTDELIQRMDQGELDLLLTDAPHGKKKRYKSIHLGQDKGVVVASPGFKFDKKDFPAGLDGRFYLSFSNHGRTQADIDYFFERADIHPDKIGEVDDMTLMRVIAESADCFTILPRRAVKKSIAQKQLKILGELNSIEFGLWAIIPSLSANKSFVKSLIKDHFVSKRT